MKIAMLSRQTGSPECLAEIRGERRCGSHVEKLPKTYLVLRSRGPMPLLCKSSTCRKSSCDSLHYEARTRTEVFSINDGLRGRLQPSAVRNNFHDFVGLHGA
jgi:hypothetical protein